MKTWISPKTKKGLPSKIQGLGIFAMEDISKDEIVIVKSGHIINLEKLKSLNFKIHPEVQISDDLFICPINESELEESMAYINHSCNPNIGARGDIVFVAMRDVKAGEELVIDYGMINNQDFSMECACMADKCRKIITGYDFLLPEVQKYDKYLSAYIQSKIKK
jgi:SET domain-containing protein